MTDQFGLSKEEFKIISAQIERRKKLRCEFLKLRTDPCKHAQQAGYVFDTAMHRFLAMKATQVQRFQPNLSSVLSTTAMIIPMAIYGYILKTTRAERENQIRCGCIRYKDRLFKFC